MKSFAHILAHGNNSESTILKAVSASLMVETANEILNAFFGSSKSPMAVANYLKNGQLRLTCTSAAVAQEIKLNELRLLALINKKANGPVVKKINCNF